MFDLGTQELIVIFIVALLVFGPKRLPELARTLGRGMNELRAALRGVKDSIEESEIAEEIKKARSAVEEELINTSFEVYSKEEESEKMKARGEIIERPAEEEKKVDG